MPNLMRSTVPLGVAAGCAAAFLIPGPPPAEAFAGDEIASLRAQGPAALAGLLARYDRLPAGVVRDELALTIDKVAAQRYATESRLYWYTDLAQAEAVARTAHRPILALRMLGRLDEDLSCANSRLFRTTLYANADVSKFLRDNFVLYWSSERPVPRVTIDFGDGRKIESTTTGNSAHYVLDEHGTVLDVLPGLYAPAIFKQELGKSVALAKRVRGLDAKRRAAATVEFHRAAMEQREAAFASIRGTRYTPGDRDFVAPIERAQRATMAKASIEMRQLAQIGIDAGTISAADISQWATIGQRLWKLGESTQPRRIDFDQPRKPAPYGAFATFDPQSVALIARLHNANRSRLPADANELQQLVVRLEHAVIADSALAELSLRTQIRSQIVATADLRFDTLNAWIYANVFHTPKVDPWLGLLPRTDFTGLPGDGVVMP